MSSSSTTLSLDHLLPSEQLCYVHCTICDSFLTMSVPSTRLFKTVTVSCGHCTNLILPVNMCGLLLSSSHNLLQEEMPNPTPDDFSMLARILADDELPRPPTTNQPLEKRQRVPQEAFGAASKNWAHFRHIHFGLMPDETMKKTNVCQSEGDMVLMNFASANVGVSLC